MMVCSLKVLRGSTKKELATKSAVVVGTAVDAGSRANREFDGAVTHGAVWTRAPLDSAIPGLGLRLRHAVPLGHRLATTQRAPSGAFWC
jgi:hypothetical protein